MIRIDLPSRLLGISFSHPKVQKLIHHKFDVQATATRRATHCEVWELSADSSVKPKLISKAIVTTHHKDTFKRWMGRKIALARALKFTNLSKFERTAVWEAYHNRSVEGLTLELERTLRAEVEADNEEIDVNDALGG